MTKARMPMANRILFVILLMSKGLSFCIGKARITRSVSGYSIWIKERERQRGEPKPPILLSEQCQYLLTVGSSLHLLTTQDMLHDTLRTDDEGTTLRTHVLTTIHALLYPYPEKLVELCVLIDNQSERQAVLLYEPLVALGTIRANAYYLYAPRSKVCIAVTQATRLSRTPRGVVLGIEIESYTLTGVIRQPYLFALLVDAEEVLYFIAYLHSCFY